jgi:hypothetical protein
MWPYDAAMSSQSALRPSKDVVFRVLEDEAVLVHLGTNRIYSLNPSGARFWQLFADGRSQAEIRGELLREFDVSAEQVEAEIEGLLASLESEGLVTVDRSA